MRNILSKKGFILFGPLHCCSQRWWQIFLLGIDTLAFASSSLFLSAAWLFSKGKSNLTITFSIGLCVGSLTACVVQISRRSFARFILNDDDGYSTCKSPQCAGYSERWPGGNGAAISAWRAIPEVSDLGRFAKWNWFWVAGYFLVLRAALACAVWQDNLFWCGAVSIRITHPSLSKSTQNLARPFRY